MEKRFGTFNGVFLPAFLTIIGVIFYLRLGWVVGNSGIAGAIGIILIAHVITISTAFSMSSITTNMKVKGGGAYYLISRSLGLEIGGAIGITLYLSQAISVALYVLGFMEALKEIVDIFIFKDYFASAKEIVFLGIHTDMPTLIISSTVAIIIGIISIVGADLAIKAQYFIFGVIILSLINIFISGNYSAEYEMIGKFTESKSFWGAFAMFFPAVTGILAGASMSGDLKKPKRDIPVGTFIAIAITLLIYIAQAVWFGLNVSPEKLISEKMILLTSTRFPLLIAGGVWAATLSSALGSIIGAPRTMQALARDGVLPSFLGKGSGEADEPRIASLITFAIGFVFIIMGNLDFVAPVITMFFLNTYGAVNLVAGIETLVGNPSYRPTFKTPWYVSFTGAIGSYWVMFLINKTATIISLIVTLLIYFILSRKGIKRTWGDIRNGVWISVIRFSLLKLRFQEKKGMKNWKPDILVFTGNPRQRGVLLGVANMLSKGQGIITLFNFIKGDISEKASEKERTIEKLNRFLRMKKIMAFPEVVIGEDFREAAIHSLQANGIGTIKPNTVLTGYPGEGSNHKVFVDFLHDMISLNKNVLTVKYNNEKRFGRRQRIDLWWGGFKGNGRLMLILAHIISINETWKNAQINIKVIRSRNDDIEAEKEKLMEAFDDLRIKANVDIIISSGKVSKTIFKNSRDADLVILGLADVIKGNEDIYFERLEELSKNLPTTIFVKSTNIDWIE